MGLWVWDRQVYPATSCCPKPEGYSFSIRLYCVSKYNTNTHTYTYTHTHSEKHYGTTAQGDKSSTLHSPELMSRERQQRLVVHHYIYTTGKTKRGYHHNTMSFNQAQKQTDNKHKPVHLIKKERQRHSESHCGWCPTCFEQTTELGIHFRFHKCFSLFYFQVKWKKIPMKLM